MTYAEVIAKRVNELCLTRKITLNKLATLSGLRQSTLDNISRGHTKNPTLKTLHRIAVGLDMTVSELLDFEAMNETVFEDE
jgi:transcriptional regulator with XRE-family HTH domain